MSQSLIRAWRLSEARYAGDLSEPALIQDLDPKALPRWLECHPTWSGECLLGRQLVAIWAAARPGSAIRGGAPRQEPFAQSVASSHGAGVTGAQGTVQARSTPGLIRVREMPGCLFRGVIFLWLSQQAERKRTRPSSTTPRSKAEIDQVTPDFSASPKRGVRSPRTRPWSSAKR